MKMTKCGRFGPNLTEFSDQAEFDYSINTIRSSVMRSLARLNTGYLDTVYLHDVEFMCTPLGLAEYGLEAGDEEKVRGEGDQKILDAVAELRNMQDEGLIRSIGITGV